MFLLSSAAGDWSLGQIIDIFQLLSAAYLQGADADDLTRVYETESKLLDPWVDSPAEITADDWREHLGCREYVSIYMIYLFTGNR